MIGNPFSAFSAKLFGGAAIALLIVAGVQSCTIDRVTRERDEARQQRDDTRAAFDATVVNYRAAAVQFAAIAAANVARVNAERDAINERRVHELQIARDNAAVRYRRLLATAAEADSRGAGDADLSAIAEATCRAYAATGCHELPARLKAAQDNTDQLIKLQAWADDQAAVSTAPAQVEAAPD